MHILFERCFGHIFSFHFLALLIKKLSYKQIATRDNSNVQSHDQEQNKLNSTISTDIGGHTLRHDKIIKSSFNKNNVAAIKNK